MKLPFADNLSKKVWDNLVKLNETNDYAYLIQAIELCGIRPDPAYQCYMNLKKIERKGTKLILYGLGESAHSMWKTEQTRKNTPGYLNFPFLGDIAWYGMCDKKFDCFKEGFMGYKVMSPLELEKMKDEDICICIGAPDFYEEIEEELIDLGIKKDRIVRYIYPKTICYENKQYFDDFLEIRPETTMIDGGCFRCDSIQRFIEWNNEQGYQSIISYEPDKKNYEICNNIIKEKMWKNVELIHAGLGEEESFCNFIGNGDDTSYIDEKGIEQTRMVSIDETIGNKSVSFIKLDVEGFELETLKGARECIKREHPRMAISLYHKKEDIIDIPKYIMQLSKDYQFYMRIYSNAYLEIVLYAV